MNDRVIYKCTNFLKHLRPRNEATGEIEWLVGDGTPCSECHSRLYADYLPIPLIRINGKSKALRYQSLYTGDDDDKRRD